MGESGIRSFVAIRLDERTHRELGRLMDDLRTALPERSVRWVAPENIHLTLKFLGDVAPAQVEPIAAALREVARHTGPFVFEVGGCGCFPNSRRPNVVWVGLHEASGALESLQKEVEQALARLGFPPEGRPFSPHLTLGRVRREAPSATIREIGQAMERWECPTLGTQSVDTIYLFRSDLRPTGSIYTVLAEAPFGGR